MAYTEQQLKDKIQELLQSSGIGAKFNIKTTIKRLLPLVNRKDENLVMAQYDLFTSMGMGHIFFTDSRLLFLQSGSWFPKDKEIYLNNIASFEHSKSHLNGLYTVAINDNGGKVFKFHNLKEHSANAIIDTLQKIKDKNNTPAQIVQPLSQADELKKFGELLEKGLITQEEFDKKKSQILNL